MDTTPTIAPGWYADPAGPGSLRWWDGTRWTDHTVPDAGAAATIDQPTWSSGTTHPTARPARGGVGAGAVVGIAVGALLVGLVLGVLVGRATGGGRTIDVADGEVARVVPGDRVEGRVTDEPFRADLVLEEDDEVTVDAASNDLDTLLRLLTEDGELVAENDDVGGQCCDSQLRLSLDAGTYRIEVTDLGGSQQGRVAVRVR